MRWMGVMRAILGFLLAPVPLLLPIMWVAIGVDAENSRAASLLTVAAVFYGPTLLFGVPTHALLLRFGKRRLWHYLAAAMALPVLATLAVFTMEIVQTDG